LVGCEALLRWRSETLGEVPPVDFIPVAEESGLILPIGAWVIRTAAAQAKAWQDAGTFSGVMAVNLSVVQFRQSHFARQLEQMLMDAGLDTNRFEIELTESSMMDDPDNVARTLDYLKGKGLLVAIDDFGTGYSSLARLRRFCISRLKLDCSFVQDLGSDGESRSIARAVIALAHNLGLRCIAEGVETAEQLLWLGTEGCDEAQGFQLAPPMPVADFEAWVRVFPGLPPASPDQPQ
jgi:EAL domain-containing protein (putative c-di-GMP-specific phosphodiesterase class I)